MFILKIATINADIMVLICMKIRHLFYVYINTINGFGNLVTLLYKLTSNDIILQFKTNNDKRISIEKTKLKLINN